MITYRTPTFTATGGSAGSVRSADGFIDLQIVCPYSNATRNNIAVRLSVTPADGGQYVVT